MNWNTFIFANYEILLAITFSLITVFITKKVLNKTLLNRGKEENNHYENIATAIFSGTIILCVLLLVNSSLLPAVDTLNVMLLSGDSLTFDMFVTSFSYFLLFFGISIILSLALIFLTLKVYFIATIDVDELKELKSKNIAVAIIMSMVILGITLSVKPSLERFIFSMVSYEKPLINHAPELKKGEQKVFEKKNQPSEKEKLI